MSGFKQEKVYIAIDLKSFYASVECVERGLDPLSTNLVVADPTRTSKTICLAVSPSLKQKGIPGRPRLFEVEQKVKDVNRQRLSQCGQKSFSGSSVFAGELDHDPTLELSYITASPRMALYIKYSTTVYQIYLKYIAPEDIHVYSIDEVFMDVTGYLRTYNLTPHELAMTMIRDVLHTTGITATAGIGTNMYLAKIAMDIVAKHIPADKDGVRIASLDERSYREKLWNHRPLTDFWRIGRGYARKLESAGLHTMGDIARCSIGSPDSLHNEDLLYKLFGINAELLIDHAWGWEPVTIADIKSYRPENSSISSGQVLSQPYSWEKARLVTREMADLLVLDLVEKKLVTDQIVLTISYDSDNLKDPDIRSKYHGPVTTDYYGRPAPKHAHGSINLKELNSSTRQILAAVEELYDRITDPILLIRRINVTANHVVEEQTVSPVQEWEQLDLFTDYEALKKEREAKAAEDKKERQIQEAMLEIKKRYGKNAILKGMNLQEGATAVSRNSQIGGHKA